MAENSKKKDFTHEMLKKSDIIFQDYIQKLVPVNVYSIAPPKRKIMIVLENPGEGNFYKEQRKNLKNRYDKWKANQIKFIDFIEACQNIMKEWLLDPKDGIKKRFSTFMERIMPLLQYYQKDITESYEELINHVLFSPKTLLYITDAMKTVLKIDDKETSKKWIETLKEEIAIVDPEVIFLMGNYAWNYYYKGLDKEVQKTLSKFKTEKGRLRGISKIHGTYQIIQDRMVVPLILISGQYFKEKTFWSDFPDIEEIIKEIQINSKKKE